MRRYIPIVTILQINQAKLDGPWTEGYVLDRHTVSSTLIGPNQWDTVRTPLGQELYNLKYGGSKAVINIVDTCEAFIKSVNWIGEVDIVVPAPPTRSRAFQPVFSVASELAARLKIPVETAALTKTVVTSQMKDIPSWSEREAKAKESIHAAVVGIAGKSILLIDDLTESGATLRRSASTLLEDAKVKAVRTLVLTRTR
jgi:competence protein ComFC